MALMRGVETAAGTGWHLQADGTNDDGRGRRRGAASHPPLWPPVESGTRPPSSLLHGFGFPSSPAPPPPTPQGQISGLGSVCSENLAFCVQRLQQTRKVEGQGQAALPKGLWGPLQGQPGRGTGWYAWKGGSCWGMPQPGPVLTTIPRLCYLQSQHPLTHRQSWGAHGTWVTRLPWRTLQRKVDIMNPSPGKKRSRSQDA